MGNRNISQRARGSRGAAGEARRGTRTTLASEQQGTRGAAVGLAGDDARRGAAGRGAFHTIPSARPGEADPGAPRMRADGAVQGRKESVARLFAGSAGRHNKARRLTSTSGFLAGDPTPSVVAVRCLQAEERSAVFKHTCRCCGKRWTAGDPHRPWVSEATYCGACARLNQGVLQLRDAVQPRTDTHCQHGQPRRPRSAKIASRRWPGKR